MRANFTKMITAVAAAGTICAVGVGIFNFFFTAAHLRQFEPKIKCLTSSKRSSYFFSFFTLPSPVLYPPHFSQSTKISKSQSR